MADQIEDQVLYEETLPGEEPVDAPAEADVDPMKAKLKGLSGHQKNRRLALAKYGEAGDERIESDRNDFRLEFVNAEDRTRATEELQGKARKTTNGKLAIGGDRYLMWVKSQGFPDGMLRVVWPEDRAEEVEAARIAREETRAQAKAEREAAKAEAKALREAAKAEKEAQKAAEQEAREIAELEGTIEVKPKKAKKSKKAQPVVEDDDNEGSNDMVDVG